MNTPRDQSKAIHATFNANPEVTKLAKQPPQQKSSDEVMTYVERMKKDGYVIVKNVLSKEKLQRIRSALAPYLQKTGRNRFEGEQTQRVYALLDKSPEFEDLAMDPIMTGILDNFLLPNYLITAYQAINILPGSPHQPYHHDDQFMNVTRPHRPFSIAVIYAIDDFTEQNGATHVFPGSHLWGEEETPVSKKAKPVPSVMPAGSAVYFVSTLWHGGGPNTSNAQRLAVSAQYCEPWIRPQENQLLIVPFQKAEKMHPKVQSLIGYSIHPPFIGHVNGLHPLKQLEAILGEQAEPWNSKKAAKL